MSARENEGGEQDRRKFLKKLSIGGAAAGLGLLAGTSPAGAATTVTPSKVQTDNLDNIVSIDGGGSTINLQDNINLNSNTIESVGTINTDNLHTPSRSADVVVWKDSGGTIHADGEDSEIASGTDALTVINTAIDNSSAGDVILFDGTFTITANGNGVELKGNRTYIGYSATFVNNMGGSGNNFIIYNENRASSTTHDEHINIYGLTVDYNDTTPSDGNVQMLIENAKYVRVKDMVLKNHRAPTSGGAGRFIAFESVENVVVENCTLYGAARDSSLAQPGINFGEGATGRDLTAGSRHVKILNNTVRDVTDDGILAGEGQTSYDIEVAHNTVDKTQGGNGNCVSLSGSRRVQVHDNHLKGSGNSGSIGLRGSASSDTVKHAHIHNNFIELTAPSNSDFYGYALVGVDVDGYENIKFTDNLVRGSVHKHVIQFDKSNTNVIIRGNIFDISSHNTAGQVIRNAGASSAAQFRVEGNIFDDDGADRVILANALSNAYIADNDFNQSNVGSEHLNVDGDGQVLRNQLSSVLTITGPWTVKRNIGYVTENSGSETQSGDGSTSTFTIAHGLDETPSFASVDPGSGDADGDFHVSNVDGTNIELTYSSAPASGTDNLTWYWRAEA